MAIKEAVMARYSVATTKNNLSSLIDKALAGEEVVITRHGKPTVLLKTVPPEQPNVDMVKRLEWDERLRALRESLRPMSKRGVGTVREMRDEYRY
jgi:prevent-host-death family protein